MRIDIPAFEKAKILVVGDVMLDQYWYGNTSRISPEAPVPVVKINELEARAGGAGNVALNLRALGCEVTLLSAVGDDTAGIKLKTILEEAGVKCIFKHLSNASTVTKLRVIGRNQQLIRLDFEEDIVSLDASYLLTIFQQEVTKADIVILSDYAKGVLAQIEPFIANARHFNIPVLIDPKSTDFSLYRGAAVVKPNLKEFEAVVGPCRTEEDLVVRGIDLIRTHGIQALMITRGEHGMTLLTDNVDPIHMPTRAREVYDVTGAGDTVIATLAATMATGKDLATSAMYANMAAGIVVQKLGAATVSVPELRRALQRHHDSELGILTEEELLVTVADARAHGETIVMTNGCFDILHAGHIAYLEEAKLLGKRLIVAVNDDHSVRRLKGDGRPVNNVHDRMTVLAALRAVDWVIAFSEDTPERLVKAVSPDVLVKGGDYQINEIAGNTHVLANGGIVKTLAFINGYSTSALIKRVISNSR